MDALEKTAPPDARTPHGAKAREQLESLPNLTQFPAYAVDQGYGASYGRTTSNDSEVMWVPARQAREENDYLTQIIRCMSVVVHQHHRSVRACNMASANGLTLPIWLHNEMAKREKKAADDYTCGPWIDAEELVVDVSRKNLAGKNSVCVDLGALFSGDCAKACARQCPLFEPGLCHHILCALNKKKTAWLPYIRVEETIEVRNSSVQRV